MGITNFNGTPTNISKTISNPFLGNQILNISGVYYINDQLLDGGSTSGNILIASSNDQYISLEDENGDLLLANFDVILLGGGNDIINLASTTNSVDDIVINTGSGNNVVWSGAGDDEITALDGDDIIHGGPGNDTIYAGGGNDIIIGGQGNDIIDAGQGFDTIVYSGSFSDYEVLEENSIMTISSINALDGTDTVVGGEKFQFNDGILENGVFTAFVNDQTFVATVGAEVFEGTEAGNDTVDYSNSSSKVHVNLERGAGEDGFAESDLYISIENVIGSDFGKDVIYGSSVDNILLGMGGNDIIEGGEGADLIDGGEGRDFAYYKHSSEGVDIDLTRSVQFGGDAEGDVLLNIEHVFGSKHDDIIVGDDGRNKLYGSQGDDILSGGGGNDTLVGGKGNDTYNYTSGFDKIKEKGNSDHDKVVFDARWSVDDVFVAGNLLILRNENESGKILFKDIDKIEEFVFGENSYDLETLQSFSFPQNIFGSVFFSDTFIATQHGERFFGFLGSDTVDYSQSEESVRVYLDDNRGDGAGYSAGDHYYLIENITGSNANGTDVIHGDRKANVLKGLAGDDMLYGGSDDDFLFGGAGSDVLHGESGADTFVFERIVAFEGVDQIADFNLADCDRINIADVLFGYDQIEDSITDFVQITNNGIDSIISVDLDGEGTNHDFVQIAVVANVTGLSDVAALEENGVLVTV